MRRRTTLHLLPLLTLPGVAVAQTAPSHVLLLTAPDGAPAAAATATLRLQPPHRLSLQTGLPDAIHPGFPDQTTWQMLPANARGVVRLPAGPDTAGAAASGLVTTPTGLGSLVFDLWPGRAQRLPMRPMAELVFGSEVVAVHAKALRGDGSSFSLPSQTGTAVRLPAGDYELWLAATDGVWWRREQLGEGQRLAIDLSGPAQAVNCRAGTTLTPAGRPDLPLGDGSNLLLRGGALGATFRSHHDGWLAGPFGLTSAPQREPLAWPPPPVDPATVILPAGNDTASLGWMISAVGTSGGDFQLVHVAPPQAAGWTVPANVPGDRWLCGIQPGHAPFALPWSDRARLADLAGWPVGTPLQVQVRTEGGLPLVGAPIDYTPDGMPLARVEARTDAFGVARFGPVLGPGALRLADARVLNRDLHLATIPATTVEVATEAGQSIRGVVRHPDGRPAPAVPVLLRDARGLLRPAVRSTLTDGDGTFAFAGLPDGVDFVLLAQTAVGAHTLLARVPRIRGGGEAELTLRDEDPVLQPDGGR